jgi:hypothetical protein
MKSAKRHRWLIAILITLTATHALGETRNGFDLQHSLLIRFDPINRSVTAHDAAGRQLPAVPGFWFAWYAFHPETEVFTAERRR